MTQTFRVYSRPEHWHIYAIVMETGDKSFAVKIGVSSTPYDRYNTLRTGIPFRSVMLYSLVGIKSKAYRLERALHEAFADRNTQGEWFKFGLDEKVEFHTKTKLLYLEHVGKSLEWDQITLKNVNAYQNAAPRRYKGRNRQREWNKYRHSK